MTGIDITNNKKSKNIYQDRYNLKRINGIKDKGVKINMLMRLLGKRKQEIKYLRNLVRILRPNQALQVDEADGNCPHSFEDKSIDGNEVLCHSCGKRWKLSQLN